MILIEGNTHYSFEIAQICLGKPFGETILPSLYLKALSKYI